MTVPYNILARFLFDRNSLSVTWTPASLIKPKGLVKAEDDYWGTLNKHSLYNSDLVCLDKWHVQKGLHLSLGTTDYKAQLYSSTHRDEIINQWGIEYTSRALGVSAILISKDNAFFVIRNSEQAGEYPRYWDVPGGHIDYPNPGQVPDPFKAMAQELWEELALLVELDELYCIGLIEVKRTLKPELLFVAKSEFKSKDIVDRAKQAADSHEYSQLLSISVDKIAEWTMNNSDFTTPSALAVLQFYKETIRRT